MRGNYMYAHKAACSLSEEIHTWYLYASEVRPKRPREGQHSMNVLHLTSALTDSSTLALLASSPLSSALRTAAAAAALATATVSLPPGTPPLLLLCAAQSGECRHSKQVSA